MWFAVAVLIKDVYGPGNVVGQEGCGRGGHLPHWAPQNTGLSRQFLTKTKQNKNPTSLGALHVTGQGTEPEVKEFHFPRVTRYVCTHGRAYVCARIWRAKSALCAWLRGSLTDSANNPIIGTISISTFLPGESQGLRSLLGCRLWGHTESDTTEAT